MSKKYSRALSFLLTLMLVVGIIPWTAEDSHATVAEAKLQLGMAGVANGDMVWFGTRDDEPLKWRVLSTLGDTGPDGAELEDTSAAGEVLLISKNKLDLIHFDSGTNNVWDSCGAKTLYCDGLYNDYTTWSNLAEHDAVNLTSITESFESYTTDALNNKTFGPASISNNHFFFLSAKEADKYFTSVEDRDAATTSGSFVLGAWWLRSPTDSSYAYVSVGNVYLGKFGISGENSQDHTAGLQENQYARPAFNLKPENVLFVSDTSDGKDLTTTGAFEAIPQGSGTSEWKLTLLDTTEHGSFAVAQTSASAIYGQTETVTLNYSGAAYGADEHVSALLCDSTGATANYYCSSDELSSASGTVTFTLPAGLTTGTYKLKVFNEKKNDTGGNDFASAFKEVTLNVTLPQETTPTATFSAIDASTGTLSDVASGMKYSLNGGATWEGISNTSVLLAFLGTPCTISIVKSGNGSTTSDSDAQNITVTRAEKPTSLSTTGCTTSSNNDGTITGLDSTKIYEYKIDGSSSYTDVAANSTSIIGLANGTYYVRVKASGTVLASEDSDALTINEYVPPTIYTVTITNDGHGTASASTTSGISGDEITLTAFPETGWHFNAWQVVSGGVTVTNNKFTIGTADVTIQATFEENPASGSGRRHKSSTSNTATETTTTTTTNADGSITRTTINADGSKTTVTTYKDGSTATVNTDANGNMLSVGATFSEKAISDAIAAGKPLTLPVQVKTTADRADAPEIKIDVPASVNAANPMMFEIPVTNVTSSTVIILVDANGKERIVTTSTANDTGVRMSISGDVTVKIADNAKVFADVHTGDWHSDVIAWAASREVMNGMGDGTFAPNADTTQGMMEQILFNIDGNETVEPAGGENWWTAADNWAAEGRVTDGITSHNPKAPATREVDILMMFNYAKARGYDVSARASLDGFADAVRVSAEARDAVAWAVAAGIINGTTDANGNLVLDAQGIATRAQVSAMAERFCEKLAK